MTNDVAVCDTPLVADNLDNLGIGEDVRGADNLPIDLGCHHLIADVCMNVVGKVHDSCSLQEGRSFRNMEVMPGIDCRTGLMSS